MNILKTLLLLTFIGALVLFTFQNLETARISFLSLHIEMPLSIVSVLIYILGAISGGLLFSMLKNLAKREPNQNRTNNPNY